MESDSRESKYQRSIPIRDLQRQKMTSYSPGDIKRSQNQQFTLAARLKRAKMYKKKKGDARPPAPPDDEKDIAWAVLEGAGPESDYMYHKERQARRYRDSAGSREVIQDDILDDNRKFEPTPEMVSEAEGITKGMNMQQKDYNKALRKARKRATQQYATYNDQSAEARLRASKPNVFANAPSGTDKELAKEFYESRDHLQPQPNIGRVFMKAQGMKPHLIENVMGFLGSPATMTMTTESFRGQGRNRRMVSTRNIFM